MALKPNICRTLAVTIPIEGEECQFWLIPVDSVDDISDPTRDNAWITPDNILYVYNGKQIVSINDPNTLHVKWGHIDGDIADQLDLYKILKDAVLTVKQNGTALAEDSNQAVDVNVPIMHVTVNNNEVTPVNYTLNIDLTSYAEKSDIPTNTSDLTNDSDFVTLDTVNNLIVSTDKISQMISNALANVYQYKGSVANFDALNALSTDDLKNGYVYNVEDTGRNYAWTGTAWDDLGPLLDNYATKDDVGNATLTIQKNGTSVGTFTANSKTDATANIEIPEVYTGTTADGYSTTGWKEGDIYLQTTTASADDIKQELMQTYLEAFYPVGSIYLSVNSTDPNTLFGGTWEQIKDVFLLGAGDTYTGGETGGSVRHSHAYGVRFGEYYGATSGKFQLYNNGTWTAKSTNDSGTHSDTFNNVITGTSKSLSANYTSQIASTTYGSSLPPYLAVYMWKRTA